MRTLLHRCRSAAAFALAGSLVALVAPGCEGETGSDTQDVVPENAQTPWDLAALCQQNITRHAAVRDQELAGGVVRWQCGDRPGVDGAEDRGQEYCEYHAVSKGKKITSIAEADPAAPLSCFFTSVYSDVAEGDALDKKLAKALETKANLGAKVAPDLVRMKGEFNSRDAATTLVSDSMDVAKSKNDERQAACFLASLKNPSKSEELKKACRGKKLTTKSAWAKVTKLGVKVPAEGDAGYEEFRDVTACMAVGRLANGGVDWRMSDPHISQIVVRANDECGCTYTELPQALEGFPQGTWSSADKLPPGCRRAVVDGKPYQQITICDIPESERSDLEANADWSDNLQAYCNDRFGKDIVLTAPLRAVEEAGSCTETSSEFCAAFTKTSK